MKETITIERTYKGAPVEDLWELWTTKAGLESWWGPDEFSVKVHKLELRVGGALEYDMTTKNEEIIAYLKTAGMSPTTQVRATYSEIVAKKRLAYVTRADFAKGSEPEDVTTLVEFIPVPGGTRMVLTADAMKLPEMTRNMELGWKQELEKLAKALGA